MKDPYSRYCWTEAAIDLLGWIVLAGLFVGLFWFWL